METKSDPDQNNFKIDFFFKTCSLFGVFDMHYKVSKWPNHFTDKQPGVFAILWYVPTVYDFVWDQLN